MTAETPESMMHAIGDRRPAIWPWLVMPLITLLLFYWLYSLDQVGGSGAAYGGGASESTPAHARSDSGTL